MKKGKFFSLFSGIGGFDFGLYNLGWDCVGISEIKESSLKIYYDHFGDIYNFGDVREINYAKLPDFDMLIGGFPCQSFSIAGLRKGFKDERGKMIFYIYKILLEKSPDFCVLENVKGIINHDKGKTLDSVVKLLKSLGYHVRIVLLNSIFYGSAQNRERVFFICSKYEIKKKTPKIINKDVLFRDIRDYSGNYRFITETEFNKSKIEQKRKFNFELIGGYDRVGTLTTQYGCGEKLVYENKENKFRYLTCLECERLQGFPDGWTKGISEKDRYFALGNAVNCFVSDYLFNDYLVGLLY
ncbi:MAG: (cytosine-5)-methyltransferase 1 [Thermoanaerobacterium sp.]|nr:(cytosine-5)-methyltransferase 1 [Thermoanaerobacterium sp.]